MKKIFYLASIAALALSSCAKDQTTEAQIESVKGGSKITAAVVADDTRTHLEKVDGNYEIRWSAGDQLGVYAVNGLLKNAAFTLANDSDGKAVGVFTSQNEVLDPTKEYLAVYPRHQVAKFDAVDKADHVNLNNPSKTVELIDYTDVVVNIPEIQYYRNGSFYTGTVPSVSTTFNVDADGSQLSMQPVVDYLMVNIMSTEPIETLTLRMYDRTLAASTPIKIAGVGNLSTYYVYGQKVYRHYLAAGQSAMTDKITIEVNENAANVMCHESNTYVFTIPGGLLGTNDNIEAYIWVNNDTNTDKADADFVAMDPTVSSIAFPTDSEYRVTNAQLNYYIDNKGTTSTSDDTKHSRYALQADGSTYFANGEPVVVSNMENSVFWMNPISVDTDGDYVVDARGSFRYNPNGDVIIDNQWELLEYIENYASNQKDAFLCADGAFDFSREVMEALVTENIAPAAYHQLITDYLADGFPCIAEYNSNFVGNGAVISNIFKALKSENGIFGKVAAGKTISGIEFANIEAASWVDEDDEDGDDDDEEIMYGVVLASEFKGSVEDVKITNAHGAAVMGEANVAAFNGIEFSGVSRLEHIFQNLVADNNLDMTETWATVSGVTGEIFHNITPADNANTTATTDLNVITIANGDITTYATLTAKVDAAKNDNAVAVVIDGVSYWTGDTFKATAAAASTGTYASYKKVQYAEQLAAGDVSAYVLSDMDMNWDNLQWGVDTDEYTYKAWTTPTAMTNIYGNGKTVKNIHMVQLMTASGKEVEVAPFDITTKADNLKLEDVNIDIQTNVAAGTVPANIAGFVIDTPTVNNVTLNGLNITARRADKTNNTQANYGDYRTYVGWLVANANNLQLTGSTVSNVKSNVKGLSALVGRVEISNNTRMSHIKNSSASNVEFTMGSADAPASITKFEVFSTAKNYNVYGSTVALVYNDLSKNATIKLEGVGQPKFLFKNKDNYGLNVVYTGDTIYDTLHNGDEF